MQVNPERLLLVEDLLSNENRHAKIWFLCNIIGGQIEKTQGALDEGIISVGWYSREDLTGEVVYPAVLLDENWDSFFSDDYEARYLEPRIADF